MILKLDLLVNSSSNIDNKNNENDNNTGASKKSITIQPNLISKLDAGVFPQSMKKVEDVDKNNWELVNLLKDFYLL